MHTTALRDIARPLRIEAIWNSPAAADLSGNDSYFTVPIGVDFLSPFHKREYLSPTGSRHYPLLIGVQDFAWRYRITLPIGFALRELPRDVLLQNEAGHFRAHYELADGVLTAERELVLEHDVYDPGQYPAVQALLYAQLGDVRHVLVLHRSEGEADSASAPAGAPAAETP
jgi:hypothetical protein